MATILFVGHEASRSGAPFTQLHLMRWIKENTSHKMVLALLEGGDLVPEFEKLADVYIVNTPKFALHARVWSKLNRMSGIDHSNTINKIAEYLPDVIFANSLIAINYAVKLKEKLGVKVICNIHELESAFYYMAHANYPAALVKADWLMMGSYAVKNYYMNNFPIDKNKASVIYDFIGDEDVSRRTLTDIKSLHNIPLSAKIVGAMGSLNWRKGHDIFSYVAREVIKHSPDTYFIWVGGKKESADYKLLVREVKLLGLADRVILVGEQADIQSYYEAFDVFLLTSREDPFPLVCLESALARTPIICFENSGGMPEFVRDDAGFVVDYLSIDQMAEKTLLLLGDGSLREQMGAVGRERALNNHTISKLGPSILELIEEAL
ncbi:glycosyltransferase family 4 protein [Hymenobacter sp. BT188]|uniref:glycosyltransferase family 4 protein n=1 Tax=Hymenobacter sp. BT188 TaxID=2763504 RepID=UPI001650E1A4|nr:glycosyltransferase family 4 protein [Hymenobacter sp. BT188]MBC6607161.1 glycosyltransferase family 4 protein [Hymenobacter sp. BT188]